MKHVGKILAGAIVLLLLGMFLMPGGQQGGSTAPSSSAPPPPADNADAQPRKTLGKTTQNVLELSQALADGAVRAETKITGSGLEAITSEAYRTSIGKVSVLAVEQKMQFVQAETGKLPENHAEFMKQIIAPDAPDGIQLPMLPYYQEYAYDPEGKCLVVVEFPARKEAREQGRPQR